MEVSFDQWFLKIDSNWSPDHFERWKNTFWWVCGQVNVNLWSGDQLGTFFKNRFFEEKIMIFQIFPHFSSGARLDIWFGIPKKSTFFGWKNDLDRSRSSDGVAGTSAAFYELLLGIGSVSGRLEKSQMTFYFFFKKSTFFLHYITCSTTQSVTSSLDTLLSRPCT